MNDILMKKFTKILSNLTKLADSLNIELVFYIKKKQNPTIHQQSKIIQQGLDLIASIHDFDPIKNLEFTHNVYLPHGCYKFKTAKDAAMCNNFYYEIRDDGKTFIELLIENNIEFIVEDDCIKRN